LASTEKKQQWLFYQDSGGPFTSAGILWFWQQLMAHAKATPIIQGDDCVFNLSQ
jgi:hypothetical protein